MRALCVAILSSSVAMAETHSFGTLLQCAAGSRCLWAGADGTPVVSDEIVRQMMESEGIDGDEEKQRLEEHMRYLEAVQMHAAEEGLAFTYKIGVNARHLYLDGNRKLTAKQFVRQEVHAQTRRRLEEAEEAMQVKPEASRRLAVTLPSTLNWCSTDNPLKRNICTSVKSQNKCGSCWAFAATDAIETAVAVNSGNSPQALSPQQFLDCSKREMTATFEYCWAASGAKGATWLQPEMKWGSQNNVCDGGMTHGAFQDAAALHLSLMTELDMPYKEVDVVTLNPFKTTTTKAPSVSSANATCENDSTKAAASINNWEQVVGKKCDNSTDATELLKIALQQQPISVAINSGSNFKDYKGGIYECPNSGDFTDSSEIDHAVVLVGYGTDGSTDYWILKNSYSPQWGDKGFLKLKMDSKINCGVNVFPVIPLGATAGAVKSVVDGGGDRLFLGFAPGVWIAAAVVVSIATIVLTVIGVIVSNRRRAAMLKQ
uniref:Peptidase C1A papain C-terminal domain-containing protein n=1 Tax=Globisporangium ultimum (strain ATCC 200006 / CBS 805.95 / DAOM BR144) TaxID=431595 RepID=K3W742_GLOUD